MNEPKTAYEYLVLCKNNKSSKLSFDRTIDVCKQTGDMIKVDFKRQIIYFGTELKIRFVSATQYYDVVSHGSSSAIVVGDKAFDAKLDELLKSLEEKKDD